TFLTGFVLLTAFGVRSIIITSAIILAATALALWLLARWSDLGGPESLQPGVNPTHAGNTASRSSGGWALVMPNAFVFTSGLCIMMVELVGSRLISRSTGTSIYTWTSLIGIVLAGLSLGNHIGGRLADRFNPSRALPHLFLLASMFCAMLLMG